MAAWLRYLVAFVVFAHGFVYVRIGGALPTPRLSLILLASALVL